MLAETGTARVGLRGTTLVTVGRDNAGRISPAASARRPQTGQRGTGLDSRPQHIRESRDRVVIANKFGFTFDGKGGQSGMDSRPAHIR